MGGKRTGTRPKEGDDVSGREEDCQTGHRGRRPKGCNTPCPIWLMRQRKKKTKSVVKTGLSNA
jgi:hypothetical protein